MAAPLRQIYDQMLEPKWVIAMGACASSGGMFNNYTILQGVDRIVPVDIYVPFCPPRPEALMEGIIRLHEAHQAGVPPASSGTEWRRELARAVPGYVSEREAFGETTVTIERERIREACEHARDELGFNMFVDLVATDYLDWGGKGVSGYIGDGERARHHPPATQGLQVLPELSRSASHQLPPARAAAGPRRACGSSAGSTKASTCRASSRSGRRATGTSASSST